LIKTFGAGASVYHTLKSRIEPLILCHFATLKLTSLLG